MNKNTGVALVLIITGIMLFLCNGNNLGGEAFLFIVSAGFFIAYFVVGIKKGKYILGFIIPACLVFMLSSYSMIQQFTNYEEDEGALFFLLMATGFLMIYIIHYVINNKVKFGAMKWPLATAIPIYVFAAFVFLMENYDVAYVRIAPAVLLIGAGLIILFNSFKKKE